jgi:cytochrome P450
MLKLEGRVEVITAELLNSIDGAGELDLTQNWSLPIPVRMIGEMLGVDADEMPQFHNGLRVLSAGLAGRSFVRFFSSCPRPSDSSAASSLASGPTPGTTSSPR